MVLYGMVWYGMVWYDMVWYGMVCRVCCHKVRSVEQTTISPDDSSKSKKRAEAAEVKREQEIAEGE